MALLRVLRFLRGLGTLASYAGSLSTCPGLILSGSLELILVRFEDLMLAPALPRFSFAILLACRRPSRCRSWPPPGAEPGRGAACDLDVRPRVGLPGRNRLDRVPDLVLLRFSRDRALEYIRRRFFGVAVELALGRLNAYAYVSLKPMTHLLLSMLHSRPEELIFIVALRP